MPARHVELSEADFKEEPNPGAERPQFREKPFEDRVALAGATGGKECQMGLEVANLRRQRRRLGRIDVRRIAHHEIEPAEIEPTGEIGAHRQDAPRGAEPAPMSRIQGSGGKGAFKASSTRCSVSGRGMSTRRSTRNTRP